MIFNATSRAKVAAAEKKWLPKLILRTVALVLVIAPIALTAFTTYYGEFYATWLLIPLGVSFFWNIAVITVRLCRPRPMHPGAIVALDLLIWIAFVIALIFAYAGAVYDINNDYNNYGPNEGYGDYYGVPYGYDAQIIGACEMAAAALSTILFFLHFTLFVWACVDTNKRNNSYLDERAAVIAKRMVADMEANGEIQMTGVNTRYQSAPLLATDGRPMGETGRDEAMGMADGGHAAGSIGIGQAPPYVIVNNDYDTRTGK